MCPAWKPSPQKTPKVHQCDANSPCHYSGCTWRSYNFHSKPDKVKWKCFVQPVDYYLFDLWIYRLWTG